MDNSASSSVETEYDAPWEPVWRAEELIPNMEAMLAGKIDRLSSLPDRERLVELDKILQQSKKSLTDGTQQTASDRATPSPLPEANDPKDEIAQALRKLKSNHNSFRCRNSDQLVTERRLPGIPAESLELIDQLKLKEMDSGLGIISSCTSLESPSHESPGLSRANSTPSLNAAQLDDLPVFYPKDMFDGELIMKTHLSNVWKFSTKNHPIIAVKYFSTAGPNSADTIRELVYTIRMNHHPNIVSVYGLVYNNPNDKLPRSAPIGYVMEFCEDGILHQMIHGNQTYTVSNVINWIRQASDGLHHLHEHGIVHRDVKPSNMLWFASTAILKICDLGLSNGIDLINTHETGTYLYMAPEVIQRGKKYNELCDSYSLGISMWEMIRRRQAYNDLALSFFELTEKILADENFRPRIDQTKAGPSLVNLIKRCWKQNPSERPSMKEINDLMNESKHDLPRTL